MLLEASLLSFRPELSQFTAVKKGVEKPHFTGHAEISNAMVSLQFRILIAYSCPYIAKSSSKY
jgi:hypothetical protein